MKRKFRLIFLSLILSCCCRNAKDKMFLLSENDINVVSYTDQQVIKFRDSKGAEFRVGVSITKENATKYEGTCAECCTTTDHIELSVVRFNGQVHTEIFPVIAISPVNINGHKGTVSLYAPGEFSSDHYALSDSFAFYTNDYTMECNNDCIENVQIENQTYPVVRVASLTQDEFIYSYYLNTNNQIIKIVKTNRNEVADPFQPPSDEQFYMIQ